VVIIRLEQDPIKPMKSSSMTVVMRWLIKTIVAVARYTWSSMKQRYH
jgi:predicted alpha/beta-hydrolase family hydrolase